VGGSGIPWGRIRTFSHEGKKLVNHTKLCVLKIFDGCPGVCECSFSISLQTPKDEIPKRLSTVR